jgi:hypothetical protein
VKSALTANTRIYIVEFIQTCFFDFGTGFSAQLRYCGHFQLLETLSALRIALIACIKIISRMPSYQHPRNRKYHRQIITDQMHDDRRCFRTLMHAARSEASLNAVNSCTYHMSQQQRDMICVRSNKHNKTKHHGGSMQHESLSLGVHLTTHIVVVVVYHNGVRDEKRVCCRRKSTKNDAWPIF